MSSELTTDLSAALDIQRGDALVLCSVLEKRLLPTLARLDEREKDKQAQTQTQAKEEQQEREEQQETDAAQISNAEREELMNAYTMAASQLDALWKNMKINESFASQLVVPFQEPPPTIPLPMEQILSTEVAVQDKKEFQYAPLGPEAELLSEEDAKAMRSLCLAHSQRISEIVDSILLPEQDLLKRDIDSADRSLKAIFNERRKQLEEAAESSKKRSREN